MLDAMRDQPREAPLVRRHSSAIFGAWTDPAGSDRDTRKENFLTHVFHQLRDGRQNDKDLILYEVLYMYQLRFDTILSQSTIRRVYNDMMSIASMRHRYADMFGEDSGYLGNRLN